MKQTLFSGLQPTGKPHIGNYLGAFKNWIGLQSKYQCIYSLVDYHALTVVLDPDELRENIRNAAADLLAIGIDPKKSILYRQSDVPQHTELAWIFSCLTPVPELERMTQYKDKVRDHGKIANTGMLTYPVLQAADILLYKAQHVPVGEDQLQHLELSRIIARKFNNRYNTKLFPEVTPIVPEKDTARVMSLSDPAKKMSKSLGERGVIFLDDSPDTIRKKISKAITDSGDHANTVTGSHNLLVLYSALAKPRDATRKQREYKLGTLSYADLKKDLADVIVDFLTPIQKKQQYYMKNPKKIDTILASGAKRARKIAEKTMAEVKKTVGL